MGKYNKYDGMPYNDAMPTFLLIIANELAEANRLKLIELKIKIESNDIGHSGQGTGYFIIDHDKIDLEDRA